MGDYDDLKKRIDTFIKEVKGFASGIAGTSTEIESNQNKYAELRTQQKAFIKEVTEFQPAKKIFFLDKKKSNLVKSLQEELTKSSKLMEKHSIPVPPEPEEAEAEDKEADNAAETTAEPNAEAAAPATPASAPNPENSGAAAAAAAEEEEEEYDEDEEEEEEEEEDEEEEEAEEDPADSATKLKKEEDSQQKTSSGDETAPKPAPRQAAPAPRKTDEEYDQPDHVAAEAEARDNEEEEDEEEEEEDEEEEEEEEDDMRSLASDEPNLYEVLHAYTGRESDMLTIVPGEQLLVLRVGDDGWWLAKNSRGHEGLVPSNLLKVVDESESGEEIDGAGESEEDSEYEETERPAGTADAAAEQQERSVSQSSHLLSGLPSGFRNSTLAKWFYEGSHGLSAHLTPKLSRSCLGYRDLLTNPTSLQVQVNSA